MSIMKFVANYNNKFINKCTNKDKQHIIISDGMLSDNYECELCKNTTTITNIITNESLEYLTSTYNGNILDNFTIISEHNTFKCNNPFHKNFEATPRNIVHCNSWCPQNGCMNKKYEHTCRVIFTYLFTFYDDSNKLDNFNLQDIDINKEYYTLEELKIITNYDKIKYYFPVIRPTELLIENLSDDIENGHNRLEIDCYNENLKIGLEVDGRNHFEYDEYLHRSDINNFKRQQELDKIKDNLCLDAGIKLLRIPYYIYTTNLQNTKKYLYDLLVENNINLNDNFNYDEYMQNNHPIIRNMIYNNFGGTNSIKLINLIRLLESRDTNYQISKYILNLELTSHKFDMICGNNHIYKTSYTNISRGRNCPKCAYNSPLTTNIVNDILCEYNVQLNEEYVPPYNKQRNFICTTIFHHEFKSNWDTMKKRIRLNINKCPMCLNILDNVPIYKYDSQFNYIKKFDNLTNILQSDIYNNDNQIKLEAKHKALIKKNIQQLNNSAYGYTWSYLKPENNKLNRNRVFTDFENAINELL